MKDIIKTNNGGSAPDFCDYNDAVRRLREAGCKVSTELGEVRQYDNAVHCGNPEDAGDPAWRKAMVPLPDDLLRRGGVRFIVEAAGDSMTGAGIHEGDCLLVEVTERRREGDILVVIVDNDATCKAYHEDDDGTVWLMPTNAHYDPIHLDGSQYQVHVCGKVVGILTQNPALSARAMRKALGEFKERRRKTAAELTDELVEGAVSAIQPQLTAARQWYCIMRVLCDRDFYATMDFDRFTADLRRWLGSSLKLEPTVAELRRMCVLSFARPVSHWNRDDAPVKGWRFDKYKELAELFERELDGEAS